MLLMELELRTSGEGSDRLYQLSHHHHCLVEQTWFALHTVFHLMENVFRYHRML